MRETYNDEKEIKQTLRCVTLQCIRETFILEMETQKELTRSWSGCEKNLFLRRKLNKLCVLYHEHIANCTVCEKHVMTRRKFNKRQVLYHVFNTLKSDFYEKDNSQT